MRAILIAASALFMMAAHALELADVLTVYQEPGLESDPVSFSIGYPRGWRAWRADFRRPDIYFGLAVPCDMATPSGLICSFSGPAPTNRADLTNFSFFSIWRSDGATPRETANKYVASLTAHGSYQAKKPRRVVTNAGDSGWLVESKYTMHFDSDPDLKMPAGPVKLMEVTPALKDIPVVDHEFFFRRTNQAPIRIDILTPRRDSSLRARLDKLVLQTLRFSNP